MGRKLRKLFVIAGLVAAGGFVYNKMRGNAEAETWETAYSPEPERAAPEPAPSDSPIADAVAADLMRAGSDDAAGADLTEALSDAAESPHTPTTPDDPAEVVDLEDR